MNPSNSLRNRLGLGPLESRLLELLWARGRAATVRDLQRSVPKLAYTTIMTTLDRLHRKQFLWRYREGRAFVYETRQTREALLSRLVSRHLGELLGESPQSSAILSTVVDVVGDVDAALLDQLESLTQEARRRLKPK
ncbi:MAG: BlaI/MecI/CopY family transcriptional regulator [Proteobacteria bacterium]|nr:BlaI/MecI/CopY family transcriptional regulator [Pseudomonadota bacterium]